MAEVFIARKVFREATDILTNERHTIEINDSDRILPVRELVKRAHGKAGLICLLNDKSDVSKTYTHNMYQAAQMAVNEINAILDIPIVKLLNLAISVL